MPAAEEAETLAHEQEEYEETPHASATMFMFDVPGGLQPGTVMKVTAPDSVVLHIPLPANVYAGDRMCMQKNAETGKWGIKHVVRGEVPPAISVEPNGQVTRRSDAELEKDLIESNVCLVNLSTTKGDIRLRIVPSWAPKGAQRFLQLVTDKYYTDVAIYRAVSGFLIQFGVINDQEKAGRYEAISDDLIRGVPIQDGSVCFAAAGPNTRTATVCIFLGEFPQLGGNPWETPIGKVTTESMDVLHSIHTGYGDMPQCGGCGPDPINLEAEGNNYILDNFPECDFVKSASWVMS
uniref:PPIase cyclophilin-type domain-containing protein n=1 Tax=Pyrodinium bahamense TaxID=73915 RepID=A0A7S0AJP8_9DINO|mmetsp:Transcript_36098/g.100197  ORF Transcript_36098/g.100197 Transcript_36098/m.100197 type:complete len:293 (+) Transcript_36098:84-962(+)